MGQSKGDGLLEYVRITFPVPHVAGLYVVVVGLYAAVGYLMYTIEYYLYLLGSLY